jgi:hypothetical protein
MPFSQVGAERKGYMYTLMIPAHFAFVAVPSVQSFVDESS